MKSNIEKIPFLLFVSLLFSISILHAQPSLQQQYQEFYDKSSTWEDYKVIKLYRLDEFWSVVSDTLDQKRQAIRSQGMEIDTLKTQLGRLGTQLAETEGALAKSEELNDSISFLGLQMSKMVYNIFVWLIILILAVTVVSIYLMFKRSNIITRKTRKDFEELEKENHELRQKARETQIKLKRELQTALNRLSEHRV